MTSPQSSRTIQASWRLAFTGLLLAAAGLAVALLRLTDPASRTTPWHAASILTTAGYGLCAVLLHHRIRTGWIPRKR